MASCDAAAVDAAAEHGAKLTVASLGCRVLERVLLSHYGGLMSCVWVFRVMRLRLADLDGFGISSAGLAISG